MVEMAESLGSSANIKDYNRSSKGNDAPSQIANYKIRYVELSKPIAGALLGGINYALAEEADLSDSSLMMVGNTISNFIAWILGEKIIHPLSVYFNLYTESQSKNPLYRNFKTLASLGTSLGIIFAILRSAANKLKLNVSIYGAYASFILGISAFAYRWYRQSLKAKPEYKKNIDAQVGTEGWSKYTKLALMIGTSTGQCIGGYISYIGGYDAMTSWSNITLYGSIAAVISFFSILILVPAINYLTRNKQVQSRGILVTKNKDSFNTNYIRSGMTLGLSIGSILGGLLGPFIAGMSPAIGIAIGAGVFAIISGIVLGAYGHKLTLYLQKSWGIPVNTDNSWSYASRSTSYLFSFIGTAIACVLCPGAALAQAIAIGSSISGFVGWFAGLGVMWKSRQVESEETKTRGSDLPWTQRISIGASRGSIIGAATGLILSLIVGGSLGLTGWILLAGALGGILGGLHKGFANTIAKRIIKKILFGDSSTPTRVVGPDNAANLDLNYKMVNSKDVTTAVVNNSRQPVMTCSTPAVINTSPTPYSLNRNLLFSSRDSFQGDIDSTRSPTVDLL